jgi:hypothetical protein
MFNPPRYSAFCFALLLGLVTNVWAQPPGILYPPLPAPLEPGVTPYSPTVTYDYSAPNSCTGCHFILGYDHTSDAMGVQWNDGSQSWQRTGHGWLDSRHAQSEYGETNNTFCAKCHSPIQAWASSSFNNGFVNGTPIPDGEFAAVTCTTCHAPDQIATVLAAQNPNASYGAAISVYLWKGFDNPASYRTLVPGQEDVLCLNCHEERHNTDSAPFAAMYSAGVRCMDCHMAPYNIFTGTASSPADPLPERFHDWKVAENVPFSCGVAGALKQFRCHSEFTAASAQKFIPFLMQQHSEWWSLPPFNGVVTTPQVAASAHSLSTAGDYRTLWQQIQQVQAAQ